MGDEAKGNKPEEIKEETIKPINRENPELLFVV